MLCGARPASVGVGGGGGLQGASAGLWGGPQRGREAIGSVCVEVQPPLSFAQRQIVSFAETGAFPPPEARETGAGRGAPGRESDTGAELRKQTGPHTCLSPLGGPSFKQVWLSGRYMGTPCPGPAHAGLCGPSRSLC